MEAGAPPGDSGSSSRTERGGSSEAEAGAPSDGLARGEESAEQLQRGGSRETLLKHTHTHTLTAAEGQQRSQSEPRLRRSASNIQKKFRQSFKFSFSTSGIDSAHSCTDSAHTATGLPYMSCDWLLGLGKGGA